MQTTQTKPAKEVAAYMTVEAACALVSISRSTFYRLLNDPDTGLDRFIFRLPGIQRLRVPREEFVAWLRSRPAIRRHREDRATR